MIRIASLLLVLVVAASAESTTVTLLHFSDYHSHALPFYAEGEADRGGIARAIGYLSRHKKDGALVFSGGDMMNRGAPAWSDRYACVEWSWLNDIVDAMAFGNHDADYGYTDFARCRDSVRYPILSANTAGFPPYVVVTSKGRKIGVFAVAGSDFSTLVRAPELRFGGAIAAAREAVHRLRSDERVDAVVLIGHQHMVDDFALAHAVPGIDLIFGSHSHVKQELTQIPGTATWFISAFQYLTYIARVAMTFDGPKLTAVTGQLVPVDGRMPVDQAVAARAAQLQKDLESDPRYRELFVPFARLERAIEVDALGRSTIHIMREATKADVALSTASSFRAALPPGPIDLETLRAAMPYDNEIVIAQLPVARAKELIAIAQSLDGDARAYASGNASGESVTVATTDYLARVAPAYRDFFAGIDLKNTGLRVRDEVRKRLAAGSLPP